MRMDNAAFRALVNERRPDGGKSTKEIAREAVEDEFARKRKGRGGGGGRRGGRGGRDEYGSDSGGSSDEDAGKKWGKDKIGKDEKGEEEDEPEWKRRRREKKAPEYRDRARERREGKASDYSAIEGLAPSGAEEEDRKRRAELSKYLGGDEEHTHLVRGLDKALAEKVRREEMGGGGSQEDGDLDDLLEEAYAEKRGTAGGRRDWRTAKPKSELGKSVLGYLLQKGTGEGAPPQTGAAGRAKGNPAVQKSIQRAVLTFSLNADARRRREAWEAPRTSVRSFAPREGEATGNRMNPLNRHMIATIAKKLDGGSNRQKERSRYGSLPEKKEGETGKASGNGKGGGDARRTEEADSTKAAKVTEATNGNTAKEDDSDDDIFADAGEYVPQAPPKPTEQGSVAENDEADKSTEETEEKPKQKESIFDNLLQEDAPAAPARQPQQPQSLSVKQPQPPSKKKVIERDLFGGGQETDQLPYHKRRGPQSAAMEGVSMTTYRGGYGEEMDVDFGGFEEDRRKKKDDDDEEKEGGEEEEEEDEEG